MGATKEEKTMKVTLKDGSVKEYASAMSVIDIAKDISEGLARVACAGEVDGERVGILGRVETCRRGVLKKGTGCALNR